MTHLLRLDVHVRGLVGIALALVVWQPLGAVATAQARDVDIRAFEAVLPPSIGKAAGPGLGECDSGVAYGTGDDGCGSMTGGPSGGLGGRS